MFNFKSHKKIKTCLALFSIVFINVFYLSFNTSAIDQGLIISPLRKEFNIDPGTSNTGEIKLTNSTSEKMIVKLSVEEFDVVNQSYDYVFTAESDVSRWIKFDQDTLSLDSNQTIAVNYTIGVPLSSEPGGRYISLFASTDDQNGENAVNLRQRIASLLYITVAGETSRSGDLLSINSPWLITSQGIWSATLQNTGSTHFESRYSAKLVNIFNNKQVSIVEGRSIIMPGTVRLINDKMPIGKYPGLYKIIYLIGLGDTSAKSETRYVVYVPKDVIFAIFVVFIFVSVYVGMRKNKLKK